MGKTWTPEQRAKILAAKQRRKAMVESLDTDRETIEDLPPRQRHQYEPRPARPSGSRWIMKAGRWDESAIEDVSGESGDMLRISEDLLPEGITLQWVTSTVYGQEQPQHRAKFERAGWIPVHPEDFDGRFDSMFAPKGVKGGINRDGLVLMAKPTDLVEKSRRKDHADARRQVQIKEQALYGGEIDAMGADHPSATKFNHVRRSMEPVRIPEE